MRRYLVVLGLAVVLAVTLPSATSSQINACWECAQPENICGVQLVHTDHDSGCLCHSWQVCGPSGECLRYCQVVLCSQCSFCPSTG